MGFTVYPFNREEISIVDGLICVTFCNIHYFLTKICFTLFEHSFANVFSQTFVHIFIHNFIDRTELKKNKVKYKPH